MDLRKYSKVALLKEFFQLPGESITQFMAELKKLDENERAQLASGVAKHNGPSNNQLDFVPVAY
mgnify:FL=1